eukprot:4997329-Prymnesium_polylepis.2
MAPRMVRLRRGATTASSRGAGVAEASRRGRAYCTRARMEGCMDAQTHGRTDARARHGRTRTTRARARTAHTRACTNARTSNTHGLCFLGLLALNRCVGTSGRPPEGSPATVRLTLGTSALSPCWSHSALAAAGSQSSITVPPQLVLMRPIGTPSDRCRSSPYR